MSKFCNVDNLCENCINLVLDTSILRLLFSSQSITGANLGGGYVTSKDQNLPKTKPRRPMQRPAVARERWNTRLYVTDASKVVLGTG